MFLNLLNFLYPCKCPYCGEIIDASLEACKECYNDLPFNFEKRNIEVLGKNILCFAQFEYKNLVQKAIINFKFFSKTSFATAFSNSLYKCITNNLKNLNFDIITAIPLSRKSKKQRGFNQSELIAKKLASRLNIKYLNAIEKYKDNKPQHKLSLEERKNNVVGIYRLKNGVNVKNKKILLVDDIITTGNTLAEASKMLLINGALDITCLTLANTKK